MIRLLVGALVRSLGRGVRQVLPLAVLLGGAFVLSQLYTPDELQAFAWGFWGWWSGLIGGEWAAYWNPMGATGTLAVVTLYLFNRMFPRRRGWHDDNYYDSGGSDDGGGDDGGGDD